MLPKKTYRKPSHQNPGQPKCGFIFETNGTLKWSNLIDQKIPHISELVIRVNMCLYKDQIFLKKYPTFLFYPGFLCEG